MLAIACKTSQKTITNRSIINADIAQTNKKSQTWYQQDYDLDRIPGISIDKWYKQNKKNPQSKEIIVAVIDTQIDDRHEDLKGQIWSNPSEIPNNGIDDDNNGYVDDVNGWNFTSNTKGDYVVWGNFEYVRVIRERDTLFKGKAESQISPQQLSNYYEYKRAEKTYEKEYSNYKNWLTSSKYSEVIFPIVKDSLKHYFPNEDYTYEQLDSLYEKYKINDKTFGQRRKDDDRDIGAMAAFMKVRFDYDEKTIEKMKETVAQLDSIVNKNINLDYNERILIGDDPKVLLKGYGSNHISISKTGFRSIQDHGTKVSGIIASNRNNGKGIKGIAQKAKIMPLNISFSGDEHDKDITMAIHYAVDNGAKVINMSFGKEFSLQKEWVFEAFKYAEEHNVLLVHCSGNNGFNIDENPYYPSDNNFDGSVDLCNNFINVGSISSRVDSTFVSNFSNYGKQNVDLFAPGEEIYTTSTGNTYTTDSGTSLAGPMVSGTAALIWSYYPNFSAVEVKQIIMESGSSYNIEVILPGTKDKKVPFSELSKSGKVLNVYNAMKLAEKRSKAKR
ncbi:S8 family serine peptidase [Flavobacterium muglaense]|uniref:S8 family serine peptidase n=1 Tax=Flavobacterium muglaense TaxID=2764716 RepID=A0A923N0B6_9FLAO|nr:S8 family serine peptidase [Flavobacterium muglaense]MBC5837291.1 S8 family serine peptidase [Flavobacterium muglaense]MBC5843785.1 S8 family serine peptidase [Flavobacterium muglaense]